MKKRVKKASKIAKKKTTPIELKEKELRKLQGGLAAALTGKRQHRPVSMVLPEEDELGTRT